MGSSIGLLCPPHPTLRIMASSAQVLRIKRSQCFVLLVGCLLWALLVMAAWRLIVLQGPFTPVSCVQLRMSEVEPALADRFRSLFPELLRCFTGHSN